MSDWTNVIANRITEYNDTVEKFDQRVKDIGMALTELINLLRVDVPQVSLESKFKSKFSPEWSVRINGKTEVISEQMVKEAQSDTERDPVNGGFQNESLSVKDALIKILLEKFKWELPKE